MRCSHFVQSFWESHFVHRCTLLVCPRLALNLFFICIRIEVSLVASRTWKRISDIKEHKIFGFFLVVEASWVDLVCFSQPPVKRARFASSAWWERRQLLTKCTFQVFPAVTQSPIGLFNKFKGSSQARVASCLLWREWKGSQLIPLSLWMQAKGKLKVFICHQLVTEFSLILINPGAARQEKSLCWKRWWWWWKWRALFRLLLCPSTDTLTVDQLDRVATWPMRERSERNNQLEHRHGLISWFRLVRVVKQVEWWLKLGTPDGFLLFCSLCGH